MKYIPGTRTWRGNSEQLFMSHDSSSNYNHNLGLPQLWLESHVQLGRCRNRTMAPRLLVVPSPFVTTRHIHLTHTTHAPHTPTQLTQLTQVAKGVAVFSLLWPLERERVLKVVISQLMTLIRLKQKRLCVVIDLGRRILTHHWNENLLKYKFCMWFCCWKGLGGFSKTRFCNIREKLLERFKIFKRKSFSLSLKEF